MREENNHFLTGLLLGGVAAGITALLIAPKSGKELCDDISDTYNNVTTKTGNFADDIKHKSWHYLHPNESCATCNAGSTTNFATGATLGAILGIASALLLAPKPGAKLRGDINKTYQNIVDTGEDFKDSAEKFINKMQNFNGKSLKGQSDTLSHIIDLASMGYQAWQTFQKRR